MGGVKSRRPWKKMHVANYRQRRICMGTLARAVAKKVRTPPPPRRVQAPQRRETRRPSSGSQRSPWIYAGGGALVAALIAAAIVGIVVARGGGGATNKTAATNYNALPGIRKTKAPWPPEYLYLADRLQPLDLTTLPGHIGLCSTFTCTSTFS